jgi:hypothetical protein
MTKHPALNVKSCTTCQKALSLANSHWEFEHLESPAPSPYCETCYSVARANLVAERAAYENLVEDQEAQWDSFEIPDDPDPEYDLHFEEGE